MSNLTTINAAPIDQRLKWIADNLKARTSALAKVLPPSLPVERFQQVAVNALRRNPELFRCTVESIFDAIVFAADMGLEIGGPTGESYIVPYGSKASFVAGYRGLIKLALESPNVTGIQAQVVRDGDAFSYEYGTDGFLTHRPLTGNTGNVVVAWAMADKVTGRSQFHVMDRLALDRIQAKAKGGPWRTDEVEMQRKTVVRNLCKYLDLRTDKLARAIAEEDRHAEPEVTIASSGRAEALTRQLGAPTGTPPET